MTTATMEEPSGVAYKFARSGECTNPTKVIVRVGAIGAACALLVARNPEGNWWAGYQLGGRDLAYVTLLPGAPGAQGSRIGFPAREGALCHAAGLAFAHLRGVHAGAGGKIREALERVYAVRDEAGAETSAEQSRSAAAAADDEMWPPAANKSGFQFDADGECTNPERIAIPCPTGYQCALLVAQMADGWWTFGCIRAGKDEELGKYPACIIANGEVSREEAIVAAVMVALAHHEAASPINTAIEAWFEDFEKGRAVAEVAAVADVAEPVAAAAVAEAAGVAASAILPGLEHTADENGKFTTFDRVMVPMPKKATCEIHLAQAASGKWAWGMELRLPKIGDTVAPCVSEAIYPQRDFAGDVAIEHARKFFRAAGELPLLTQAEKKIADRAGEALVRFRDEWRDKLAAEAVPAAPQRNTPTYRTEFRSLPVAKIQENPANHRKHFNPLRERELADSLVAEGLHQPIAVRALLPGEIPEGELPLGDASAPEFELIFGHRRRRAALIAGIAELEAKIYHGLTRKQATAIALIENLQRVDINAMEEAEGYAQLMADEGLTQEACAQRVGRARSTVANALGLTRLPEPVREAIRGGRLTAEHGKALLRFVPQEREREKWAAEFPKWELVVKVLAETALRDGYTSGMLEKGVPALGELRAAGLAVRIDQFGVHKVTGRQREHAAYFASGDGDWICLNPEDWAAEVKEREQRTKEREEAEKKRREEEVAKLAKGKKQLRLADLDPTQYREFKPEHEPLLELVPEAKKAAAKGVAGRTTVVIDVELAQRLEKQMLRAIRANRESAVAELEAKALKKIAKVKKVGPREIAWLVFLVVDPNSHGRLPMLSLEAHKEAKVSFGQVPRGTLAWSYVAAEIVDRREYDAKRLALLAKSDQAAVLRVLMMEYLPGALADVRANGPDSLGGRTLKWWLDTDTLWLLEETEEGRGELVEQVKNSAWYAKSVAGESAEGESGEGRE